MDTNDLAALANGFASKEVMREAAVAVLGLERRVSDLQDRLAGYDRVQAQRDELVAKNAALREAIGLMTTIKGDMVMRPDDPIGMAQEVAAYVEALKPLPARWGGFCHRSTCHAVTKRGECPGDLKVCEGQSGGSGQ
jgi:hypothetical protein